MLRLTHAVLVSATAILISVSARAADLPARVQPAAPGASAPSFSWTGFYVGGELVKAFKGAKSKSTLLGAIEEYL